MKPKLSRPGSCSFRAVLLALALVAAPAFAQLVSDSATNTLNNVTNNVGGALTVGTNGANTRLNLVNGAVVTDTTAVIGQNPTSTNNVVSVMGTNTIWSNSVSLDVRRGSVLFEGGTIFAGSLLLTNGGGAGGFFLFDQGTLVTTSASISNGQAFVVGANAATPSATFRDTNAIIIPISVTSYVAALTYPAVMNVSNLIGSITKVTVT
ncbi:MAG: hypothetical protein HY301_03755, partial [Verrucomicrobia bacterium]|nr:hypothetical protein [Verrucomicrobiota bacterium]